MSMEQLEYNVFWLADLEGDIQRYLCQYLP